MKTPLVVTRRLPESALYMVVLTIFFDGLGVSVLVPMLAPYAKTLGATTTQVGYLFAFPCAASFLASFGMSGLIRRMGRKGLFMISLTGTAFATMCQGIAWEFNVLLLGRTINGLWAVVPPLAKVYINEAGLTDDECNHWFAQVSLANQAAALFGPALGGTLALYGYNIPSFFASAVALGGALFATVYLVEIPTDEENKSPRSRAKQQRPLTKRLGLFCCASMFSSMIPKMLEAIFSLYTMQKYGLRTYDIGLLFLCAALGTMLASRLVQPIGRRLGTFSGVILVSVVQAVATIAVPLFPAPKNTVGSWCSEDKVYFVCMVVCFVITEAFYDVVVSLQSTISKDLGDQPYVQSKSFQFRQGGKTIAPMIAVHLFQYDVLYPWFIGAVFILAGAFFTHTSRPGEDDKKTAPLWGDGQWHPDQVSMEDTVELGQFMVGLLERKHLNWVSQKDKVRSYLEHSIKEIPLDSEEVYYETLQRIDSEVNIPLSDSD